MKLTRTLLCAAAITIAFTASRASAFSLTLKSISGRVTTTAYYGTNAATTATNYSVRRFVMKDLMRLITNTVKTVAPDVALPPKLVLAVDLFDTNLVTYTAVGSNILGTYTNTYFLNTQNVYLTNSEGFYFGLTGSNQDLASFSIGNIATRFRGDFAGNSSEKDVILGSLYFRNLLDQDGTLYELVISGAGVLEVKQNQKGAATMTMSVSGTGLGGPEDGELALGALDNGNGVPGICTGSFTFDGSGVAPAGGLPYSVFWWNTLRPTRQLPMMPTNMPPINPPSPPPSPIPLGNSY